MSEENLYRTLQVDPAAESEVIDAAFRRLARKYHPDSGGDAASAERMVSLNRAYEMLGDPVKRREYDASIAATNGDRSRAKTARKTEPATSPRQAPRANGQRATAEPTPRRTNPEIARFEGATIRAEDGTYLGVITVDRSRADSISNPVGSHGSEESETSIRNQSGKYGNQHGMWSAFNPHSNRPPVVEKEGRVLGYLTLNPFKQPAIDPHELLSQFAP